MSRALNRKDENDKVTLQESLGEFSSVAWCGGPDTFLLRDLYVSGITALHDKVTDR